MSTKVVGNIKLDFVAPDVVRASWTDSFGPTEADALMDFTRATKTERGLTTVVMLVDVRSASGIAASARKKIAEMAKARPWLATAVVGAAFPIKVAIELIVNATKLIQQETSPTKFFDDEPSALAWLAEQRKLAAG
jgi:hypothetical protein